MPESKGWYLRNIFPDGFVTTGEEQEFVFEYQGDKEAEASYEFVFEDEPTTVELSKTDLTTGEELPGARLQLTDENGGKREREQLIRSYYFLPGAMQTQNTEHGGEQA